MVFAQITRDVSHLECGLGHMEQKKENGEEPVDVKEIAHAEELVDADADKEKLADVDAEEPINMVKNINI